MQPLNLIWLTLLALPFSYALYDSATILKRQADVQESYDYVIVGGGLTGLVVADRLTENPNTTVLVIEAGALSDANDNNINIPGLAFAGFQPSRYQWNFTTAPLTFLGPPSPKRTAALQVGRVVGGGTAINGMFFDRASKGDYDAWTELGATGWGWDDLLPYFRKSETFTPPTPEVVNQLGITYDLAPHGTSGPIRSTYPIYVSGATMIKAWFQAFHEIGIASPQDMAAGTATGIFFVPATIDPVQRTRSYARSQHYDPVATRPNYHLLPSQLVTKILFSGTTATGVQYAPARGAQATTVSANKEVILAAGTVGSPRLLQLSGVGPRALLQRLGITPVQVLEGVGSNFQDHAGYSYSFTLSNAPVNPPTNPQADLAQYLANRTGPLTAFTGPVAAFLPLANVSTRANTLADQILAQTSGQYARPGLDSTVLAGLQKQREVIAKLLRGYDTAAIEVIPSGAGGFFFGQHRPLSRGYIEINSTDPFTYPVIDARTLENPIDVQVVIDTVRYTLRTVNTTAIAPFGRNSVNWSLINNDANLKTTIENAIGPSMGHLSSTCPMMKREWGGVVDPNLRVYGLQNLRIVDASIMPLVPATHLMASLYAVSEKAADVIRGSV